MRAKGSQPLRIARMENFCLAIVNGHSKVEAYAAAGYKGASRSGPATLARKPEVSARIDFLRKRVAEQAVNVAAVSRSEIIESLRRRRDKADEGIPLVAKDGSATDVFKPDFAAGNRADEILAKMHGFMLDVTRDENFDDALKDMDQGDVEMLLRSLLEQLDPNMRKRFAPLMQDPAIEAEVVIDPDDEGTTLQ